ncbi:MAG: dephospho-CoA kinase [Proteobacteria bacterium]|nr:MAG: dephospho-CoA kinase [Pseudomonadota bacterium]
MQHKKQLWIGITGSLGAGKSTIKNTFGPDAIGRDGALNRAWMRATIARDPGSRLRLEAITHPLIRARSKELCEAEFAKGASIVFYEAPLLFEANSETALDAVICVAASEQNRIERVMKRDGSSAAQAKALIDAQLPQDEKIRRSQYLIWNDGSEGAAKDEALKLLKGIVAD